MGIFNIHDVLEFAIHIEENGEAFYRTAAKSTDGAARSLFERLAEEEIKHREIFRQIRRTLGDYRPNETYEGEYIQYLHDYIDGKVVFGRTLPNLAESLAPIFDFAIQREMDSILYYQEIKQFVPERDHHVMDTIIGEERKHFSLLSEMRKGLK
jgi:rubrerythrin